VPMKNVFEMDMVEPALKSKMTEITSGQGEKASFEYGKKIAEKLKQKSGGK